ncbi:hypothetical protein [Cereibacter azotoformans]|uniref:hypothetical protein n=1 Tax=Cereibacter azotoformans TaxID=43057 RepID=UPI003B8A74B9
MRGESLKALSRELNVSAHRLSEWRARVLLAAQAVVAPFLGEGRLSQPTLSIDVPRHVCSEPKAVTQAGGAEKAVFFL